MTLKGNLILLHCVNATGDRRAWGESLISYRRPNVFARLAGFIARLMGR